MNSCKETNILQERNTLKREKDITLNGLAVKVLILVVPSSILLCFKEIAFHILLPMVLDKK